MASNMSNHHIINDYIAGAIGGSAGIIVGHPFDTTKVQLQTRQTSSPYSGAWDAMKNINKSGMVRGFFRGLGFPLVSYGFVNSVFFGVYGNSLTAIKGGDRHRGATYREVFLAGCCGGVAQVIVACPIDVVKIVLQSQIKKAGAASSKQYFRGPTDCLAALYRCGGLRACYRGFGLQFARDIPASGTYFLAYNVLYDAMMTRGLSDARGFFASLMAGGTAGVVSWLIIVPLDCVKSHMQADYAGSTYRRSADAARAIYRSAGLRGFFSGLSMICIRGFPLNAITFLVYSKTLVYLDDLW